MQSSHQLSQLPQPPQPAYNLLLTCTVHTYFQVSQHVALTPIQCFMYIMPCQVMLCLLFLPTSFVLRGSHVPCITV